MNLSNDSYQSSSPITAVSHDRVMTHLTQHKGFDLDRGGFGTATYNLFAHVSCTRESIFGYFWSISEGIKVTGLQWRTEAYSCSASTIATSTCAASPLELCHSGHRCCQQLRPAPHFDLKCDMELLSPWKYNEVGMPKQSNALIPKGHEK